MKAITHKAIHAALEAYDEALFGAPLTTANRILAMRSALGAAYGPASAACGAHQEQDEMACGRCGLRWSVGDTEPPACRCGGTR